MSEVPDHLLQRSQARRAALGLGGDAPAPAGAPAEAADTGAAVEKAASAAPAPAAAAAVEVAPKPPEPLPHYVEAAVRRRRVPVWAMPVVAFLPVWGVLYAQTLSKPPSTEPTQLEAGKEIYAKCSQCHGGTGGGGSGRKLAECEVVKTFPDIKGQLEFVSAGTKGFTGVYGDPKRDGGARQAGSLGNMPAWHGVLKDKEILEVVRYEREVLGGEKVDAKLIDAKGARYWEAGKPMVNTAGDLIGPDGKKLLGSDGKLAGDAPDYEKAAATTKCGA